MVRGHIIHPDDHVDTEISRAAFVNIYLEIPHQIFADGDLIVPSRESRCICLTFSALNAAKARTRHAAAGKRLRSGIFSDRELRARVKGMAETGNHPPKHYTGAAPVVNAPVWKLVNAVPVPYAPRR
jgi:hypothetical protein